MRISEQSYSIMGSKLAPRIAPVICDYTVDAENQVTEQVWYEVGVIIFEHVYHLTDTTIEEAEEE